MSVFTVEVRIVECVRCGAPLKTPATGGVVVCEYCRTENHVRSHRALSLPEPRDAQSRMQALREQLATPTESRRYTLKRVPSGGNELFTGQPIGDPALIEALREQWDLVRKPGSSTDDEHARWWYAMQLGIQYAVAELAKLRAVLETALDLLRDDGYRQLILVELVVAAKRSGDLHAASEWLARCDPNPIDVDLDSGYRRAAASVAAGRQDWRAVLSLVGARKGDVPISKNCELSLDQFRIDAHEKLGDLETSTQLLHQALGDSQDILFWLQSNEQAPITRAAMARRGRRNIAGLVVVALGLIGTVVGGVVFWLITK